MSDWYRDLDRARELRQQEDTKRANDAINDYWNHPTQGFWAVMRRQDDQRQWKAEQDARFASESWLRQQELAKEMGIPGLAEAGEIDAQRIDAGERHDQLMQLELLSAYPELDEHSRGRLNRHFMAEVLEIIAAERAAGR